MPSPSTFITFRSTPELRDSVRAIASQQGETQSTVIRWLIHQALEQRRHAQSDSGEAA